MMPETAQLFIPSDRRAALANGIRLPDRVHGSALFADVSGFTPLTEMLAREFGPQRGAEELTRRMNLVLDALIHQVDHYGGSVIGFSGDAITCWFDGDDAWRATTCALAMQTSMAQLNVADNASPISLKIAIATGAARRFQVGDPQFGLTDVLAGTTIDRLAQGEHRAEKGEVVLDAASAQSQAARLTWQERQTGDAEGAAQYLIVRAIEPPAAPHAAVTMFSLTEAQVRPWILPALYERIVGGQSSYIAELRRVVPLFLKFGGIDFDGDDHAGEKLDAFVRRIQSVAARYEGSLLQITIGDKGCYLMVTFGAPQAHDDDPVRAVAAALEMQAQADELNFIQAVQIGITSGNVCASAYGGNTRRTYATLGDETNLAARLMEYAAPGQIIISQRLANALPARYAYQAIGNVYVKGKADPIPVYQLTGLVARQMMEASSAASKTLVGRVAEQKELQEHLNALCAGQNSFVVIEADAGVGKSQLASAFMTQARAANVLTLFGTAEAIEQATPFFAWRAVLRTLLDVPESLERAAARQRVLPLLDAHALTNFAPLLDSIVPLDFAENALTAQMSGEVRTENLNALVIRLLQARAASEPLLLVVEDAHWLDSASWVLLMRCARQVKPLLLLLTMRPPGAPLPHYYTQLLNVEGVSWIELQTLPPEAASELVAHQLGVHSLSAPLAALIRERAEGNPFFSIELAYALRDSKLIQIQNAHADLSPDVDLTRLTLPDTVQGVITGRIDRLAPSQQLALKVASVIGRVFEYRLLNDVDPVDAYRANLSQDLEMLDELALTALETPVPNLSYHFKHVITQEVAYNLMLYAQRRDLHRSVAQWYERVHADNLAPYYPLLTFHWSQTEQPAETMEYAERAGVEALRVSAYQEAVGFFERVLATDANANTVEAQTRRARVTRMLGEAYRRWGRIAEAQTHLERAAELYGYPSPAVKGNLPPKLIGQVLRQTRNRLSKPHSAASPEAREKFRETAQIYEMLSESYFFQGKRGASLHASIHMLNLAEQAGPSPELARAYATLSLLSGLFGIHNLSETYYRRATETAEIVNIPATRADVERTNALYRSGVGQWERVKTQATDAMGVHQQLNDKRYWGDCVALLATADFYQAEYARATDLYKQISTEQHGIALHQMWGLTRQGAIALRRGDYARTLEFLDNAQPLLASAQEQASQIAALGFRAAAHLYRGETDDALRYADEGLARLIQSGGPTVYHALDGYFNIAEVYAVYLETPNLAADEHAKRYAQLKQVVKLWNAFCRLYPIGRPGRLLFEGTAYHFNQKPNLAQQAWRKAIAASERYQMPYEGARAQFSSARLLAATNATRREMLERALETFERLGARTDAERVRAAI